MHIITLNSEMENVKIYATTLQTLSCRDYIWRDNQVILPNNKSTLNILIIIIITKK